MRNPIRHTDDALLNDLRAYIARNYIEEKPLLSYVQRPAKNARRTDFDLYAEESVCEDAARPAPQSRPAAKRAESLADVLRQKEIGFSEYLISLLNESGEKDSTIYRRAEISRQLFHKILNDAEYRPTKSTAIQLALGLRLDTAGTQALLEKAGYALTRSSKTDLVVQYFIEHKEYSVVTINAALYDCGLPLLKTGSAV